MAIFTAIGTAIAAAVGATVTAATAFAIGLAATALVASISYQAYTASKMRKAAREAAEARKGFELVIDGGIQTLPLVYGRALVGGTRVFHNTSSSFQYVANSANRSFNLGAQAVAAGVFEYTRETEQGSVIEYENVSARPAGTLNQTVNGTKNEFLFFQQALCLGPINSVYDVVIDDSQFLDDPSLGEAATKYVFKSGSYVEDSDQKAALRLDYFYNGGNDALMSKNFADRSLASFPEIAYLSAYIRLDRDQPQFSKVPAIQTFLEGRTVRKISRTGSSPNYTYTLNTSREYTNNPAYCLLDYLLDTRVGKGLSIDQIDLEHFYNAAQICDTSVQSDSPVYVGGKIWQPTTATRTPVLQRVLPLYECNIILDTTKPVRENVEKLLTTMGDARLVWSQGKYKLLLQYPASNAQIVVAATLTDDDIAHDKPVEISWPGNGSRFNNATVKFSNEAQNFKEDSVSWPPKETRQNKRGVGAKKYLPVSGWDTVKVGGTFLNNYAVWQGNTSTTSMQWKIIAAETGIHTLNFTADNNIAISINGSNFSHDNWETINTGTVSLVANTEYTITVQASDDGGPRGAAAQLVAPSGVTLWTTRDDSYSAFINFAVTDTLYQQFLAEDNNVRLETEVFADGVTDYYHALAKAEELVRVSRTAAVIKFEYIVKDKYLEPGDIIKINSTTLKLGDTSDLYLKVDEVKLQEGAICEITGTRFDYSQLAWNVKDSEFLKIPNIYSGYITAPYYLTFKPGILQGTAENNPYADSPGTLEWAGSPDPDVTEYILYFHKFGDLDANNHQVFKEIGRSFKSPFSLPNLGSVPGIFGVKTVTTRGTSGMTVNSIATSVTQIDAALIPPQPSNLAAATSGDFNQAVLLTWNIPAVRANGILYKDHNITKIFRAKAVTAPATPVFTEVGTSLTNSFVDSSTEYGNLIYKVKFISDRNLEGSFSSTTTVLLDASNAISADSAIVYAYKRSSSAVLDNPGAVVYNFALAQITSPTVLENSWSKTIPAGVEPLYVTQANAYNANATDAILSTDWSTPVIISGSDAVNVILSNESHVFSASTDGTVLNYANSGTQIRVYEGGSELAYDGVGTSNGTWKVNTSVSNITLGTLTDSGNYATVGDHSDFSSANDTGSVTYSITGKTKQGVLFAITKAQTFSKSKTGATGTGITGDSSRIAYAKFTAVPAGSPADITTTGNATFPANNSWGNNEVWGGSVLALSAGESLYQINGIYSPTSGNTVWGYPYLSNLKVGSLSAITANTGALTVSNTLTIGTSGKIISTGTSYAGNGIFLGYDTDAYKFSVGSGSQKLTFDGSKLSVPAVTITGQIGGGNLLPNTNFSVKTTSAPANRPFGYSQYNNSGNSTTYVNPVGVNGGSAYGLKANEYITDTFGLVTANGIVDSTVVGGIPNGWRPNTSYVISYWAKKVNGANFTNMAYGWNIAPTTQTDILNPNLTTSWQKYVRRIVWGNSVEIQTGALYLTVTPGTAYANDEIHICELQVEEGDVATAYSPKPNDILPKTIVKEQIADLTITNAQIANTTLTADKIANTTLTATKFASDIEPVTLVEGSTLPTTKSTNTIYLTGTGKLYRWVGSAYSAVVDTSDLSGTISDVQIAGVSASKVSGQLTNSQIADLASTKITGQLTTAQLAISLGGGNLIQNSGFEIPGGNATGIAKYWKLFTGGIGDSGRVHSASLDTDIPKILGSKAQFVQIISTTNSTDSGIASERIPVIANQSYFASIYLKVNAPNKVYLLVRYYDAALQSLTDYSSTAVSTAYSWTRVFLSAPAPANSAFAEIMIRGITANSESFSADGAQFEQANIVSAYAPKPDEILEGTITQTEIGPEAVTTPKIAGFAITAAKIEAGAITTNKLLVTGQGKAINPDPTFADSSAWFLDSNSGSIVLTSDATSPVSGRFIRTTGSTRFKSTVLPIEGNKQYKVSMWARKPAGNGALYIRLYCYDNEWNLLNYQLIAISPETGSFEGLGSEYVTPSWNKYTGYILTSAAVSKAEIVIHANWDGNQTGTGYTDIADLRCEEYIGADLIVDGAITANKIAAGAVNANKIAANTITTDKLFVTGRGQAINEDPGCQDITAWQYGDHGDTATRVTLSDGIFGSFAFRSTTGAASSIDTKNSYPVSAGKKYKLSAWFRNNSGNGVIYFRLVDQTNTQITSLYENVTLSGSSWQKVSVEFTPTTSQKSVRIRVILNWTGTTGYHEVTDIRLEEKTEADLIVDGAITANKIAANTITTDKLLITGQGDSLNSDPNTQDITAWQGSGASIYTDPTSPSGSNKSLRITTNSGFFSNKVIPIDKNKNYQLRMWGIQESGTSTTYLTVIFYDSADNVLDGNTYPSSWPSYGTYHYFGVMGSTLPSQWTEYRISFGPDETAKIPSAAKYIRIGALSNYSGTGVQRHTGIRLMLKSDADLIVDGAIVASKIYTNAVTTDKISANAVTVSKLTLTDTTNIAENGDFEAGQVGWDNLDKIIVDPANAYSGTRVLAMPSVGTGAYAVRNNLQIPVNVGDAYYAEAWIKQLGGTGSAYVRIRGLNNADSEIWTTQGNTVNSATYTLSSVSAIVPANVVKINVELVCNSGTGTAYVDRVRMLRRANSELIVDGAIKSEKIYSGAVIAGKIGAGAVNASEIAAGAVRVQHLLVNPKSLNPDPMFESGSWAGIVEQYPSSNANVPSGCPGRVATKFNGRDNTGSLYLDVQAGEVYKISIWVNRAGVLSSTAVGWVGYSFNASGTDLLTYPQGSTLLSGWQQVVTEYTVPANVARVRLMPWIAYSGNGSEYAWFSDFQVEKKNDASLIVDGSIIANKIAADAITASKLVVENRDSVFPDPGWYDVNWWTNGAGANAGIEAVTNLSYPIIRVLRFSGNVGNFDFLTKMFPVDLGASYKYRVCIYKGSNFVGNFAISAHWPNIEWFNLGIPRSGTTDVGGWPAINVPADQWVTYNTFYTNQATNVGGNVQSQFRFTGTQTTGDLFVGIEMTRAANADLIVDGTITAGKLQANSITTDKLLVRGRGSALNDDPFTSDASAWPSTGLWGNTWSIATITDGPAGSTVIRSNPGASQTYAGSRQITFNPRKAYRIRVNARSVGANGIFYLVVDLRDANGTVIGIDGTAAYYPVSGATVPSTWTYYEGNFGYNTDRPFPANAKTMSVGALMNYNGNTGYHEVQDLRIEEMTDASLIVDGAITANKISSNFVYTKAININDKATIDSSGNASFTAVQIKDNAGNVILASGATVANSTINLPGTINNVPGGWLNSNLASGSNILFNADFSSKLIGWSVYNGFNFNINNFGINLPSNDWALGAGVGRNNNTLAIQQQGRTGGSNDYLEVVSDYFPIEAGKRYMVSAYTGAHRADVYVFMYFVNSSNNSVGNTFDNATAGAQYGVNLATASGGNNLSGYKRAYSYGEAPATAVRAYVAFRKYDTKAGEVDSWMFITRAMVEEINATATTPGSWSPGPTDLSLNDTLTLAGTNTTIVGTTVVKVKGAADSWDAQAYSVESYVGGAFVSFSPLKNTTNVMAGLNTDPTTNASYASIDYAWYFASGTLEIYESGTNVASLGSYNEAESFAITYDGSKIKYLRNGNVVRTVTPTSQITDRLFFDSSIYQLSAGLSKIKFGPLSSNAWADIGGANKPQDNANNTYVDSAGWIQGVSSGGNQSVANNENNIIRAPGGAVSINNPDSNYGAIKIRLPQYFTATMMRFTVEIYEYVSNYMCTIEIGGYNYDGGGTNKYWTNCSARVIGSSNVEYPVYFGHDGTKCCVWIGAYNEYWAYPQIRVRDFFGGHSNAQRVNWETGWSISFDQTQISQGSSANQYTDFVLDTLPGADWSKTARRPSNLSSLSGTEPIQNTQITVNGSGVLSGIGTSNVVVDNTQVLVGGTNLILNSGRFLDTTHWFDNGGGLQVDTSVTYGGYNTLKILGNAFGGIGMDIVRVKADTVYTFSALVKGNSAISGGTTSTGGYDSILHIQNWTDENSSDVHQDTGLTWDTNVTTSWKLITSTFRTAVSATAGYVRLYFYSGELVAGVSLNIAYVKLEQGNKATDWTPNPIEIQNTQIAIDSSGNITGIGTGVNTKVANNQIAVNSSGEITGIGTGVNTKVANNQIIIDSSTGAISGIGLGNSSIVDNSKVGAVNMLWGAQNGPFSAGPGQYGQTVAVLKSGTFNPHSLTTSEVLAISGNIWQDSISAAASGQYAALYIYCTDSSGNWITTVGISTSSQTPTRVSNTITLPSDIANMHTVALGLYHQGGTVNTIGTVSVDRIQVERGTVATTFRPGMEPGATVGAKVGTNLLDSAGSTLTDSSIKNNAITINAAGAIQNIGTGAGTVIDNSVIKSSRNLVYGFHKWSYIYYNGSALATNHSIVGEVRAADGRALLIPSGSVATASFSNYLNLPYNAGDSFTISFMAFCNSGTRVLVTDLFPDTLPESSFTITTTPTLYKATWSTTSADAANCRLRFFADGASSNIYIYNVQLEYGEYTTYKSSDDDTQNSAISVSSATGNISNIGTGNNLSVANNFDSRINAPGGGIFTTQSSSLTGGIRIRLPARVEQNYPMVKFTVEIYEYIAGYSCKLYISGHTSDFTWYSVSATVEGGSNVEYPVYFGHDDTYFVVWIGDTTETWSYPQVFISDVLVGYTSKQASLWGSNWEITFSTAARTNVTRTILDTYPGADWSKTARRPSNLSNLAGTEAIQNSQITISNGELVGIGTGNITVDNTYQRASNNLIANSDWTQTITMSMGWNPYGATWLQTLTYASTVSGWEGNYILEGGTTRNVYILQGAPVSGDSDTVAVDLYPTGGSWSNATGIPVTPGQKYCFSVYLQGHRCGGGVGIHFFTTGGSTLSGFETGRVVLPYGGAAKLVDYQRVYITGVAPATAAVARIYIRKYNTWPGEVNSYFWIAAPQFESINANVTTPSPYVAGPPLSVGQLGYSGDLNATYGASWGSTLSGRPANLSALSGSEGIQNGLVTISANGTLNNAGGGQVTVNGLGYYPIALQNSSNCTIYGNTITKTSGGSDWNASARSKQSYIGGAVATITCHSTQASENCFFGLDPSPDSSVSYDLKFAIYLDAGTYRVYESGSLIGTYGTYVAGDTFSVAYDGQIVNYFKNGSPFLKSSAIVSAPLFFDCALLQNNSKLTGIEFVPLTSTKSRNLLDSRTWVIQASGSQPGFPENGTSAGGANYIAYSTLPDGTPGLVWRARSGSAAGTSAEGGWNGERFGVDHTKTYRFSVWIKTIGGNNSGSFYLGVEGGTVYNISDSTQNDNPYFIANSRTYLTNDIWYLVVGYVWPSEYTGSQLTLGGVYRATDGVKIIDAVDFKWKPNIRQSYHRSYQFYTNIANNYQDFWDPRVELIDGTEPSVAALLAMGAVSGRNKVTTSNVSTFIANAAIQDAQIGNLSATKITTGSLDAARLTANSITTDKLTVGGFGDSVLLNSSFEDVSSGDSTLPAHWVRNLVWGGTASTSYRDASGNYSRSGASALILQPGAGYAADMFSDAVPVSQGEVWYMSCWVKSGGTNAGTSPGFYFRARGGATPSTADVGTELYIGVENYVVPSDWTYYQGRITIPAGMKWLRVLFLNYSTNTGNYILVDQVELKKAVTSGKIDITAGSAAGRITISDNSIKVYDDNNTIRVKIGVL